MSEERTGRSPWTGRAAEGLTIVLSVLLALAADSAWSYRGDRAEERRLLRGLTEEFVEADREVDNDLEARADMLRRLESMRDARTDGTVSADSASVLVAALLDWRFYTPAHAVLDDAISSGRLDLIRSADVRRALMAYDQERGRLEVFDSRERDLVSERLEPFLVDHVALGELLTGPATADDVSRFLSLITTDDTFGGLVALKWQRTDEASTFSRVVKRAIADLLASLDAES